MWKYSLIMAGAIWAACMCAFQKEKLDEMQAEIMYHERELSIERERLSAVMSAVEELQSYVIPAKEGNE